MIEELLKEIRMLQQACDLLSKIYIELGPYRDGKIDDKTWDAVRDFFKFDDSE
jgi:hypothetical protein